jgi:hypothetical protein
MDEFLEQILTPEQLARVRKPVPGQRPPAEHRAGVLDYENRPDVHPTFLKDGPAPSRERLEGESPHGSEPDNPLNYDGIRDELKVTMKLPPTGAERRKQIFEEQKRSSEKQRHEFLIDHGPELD